MRVLVTGGFGFIGSNLVRSLTERYDADVHVLDSMTYAARPDWVKAHALAHRVSLHQVDLRDFEATKFALSHSRPDMIFHLAAESHVCRSIEGPRDFVETNIVGTFNLIEAMRQLDMLETRLVHVSTDEVFGELAEDEHPFDKDTQIQPRSPYAASKAASDHLVMSYVHTYGLNAVVTNCSNNFGPNQHEEKLIPKTILSLLHSKPVTIYGNGEQIRDWIWVDDHCRGLVSAALIGQKGERYLFGGDMELTNLQVVHEVARLMREMMPDLPTKIVHTNDRPTDDFRYAIDNTHAMQTLSWSPFREQFEDNLKETIQWYLNKTP